MQMMAMMNMMSAQANLAAAQTNRNNGDKQDKNDKAETAKAAQITDLKLTEFKAPESAKEVSGGVDMKELSYVSSGDPAVAQTPLPETAPGAALQIVSQFQPVKPVVSPIPPAPEVAPKADNSLSGPSSLPATISKDKKESDDSRIGYDQSGGPLAPRLGSVPLIPAAATPAGAQTLDGGNVTSLGDGRRGRNAIADTPEIAEGVGGGGGGRSENVNISEMLGGLFGNKAAPGASLEEIALPAAETQEDPGSNIFEYASYRYRKLELKARPKRAVAGVKTAKQ